MKGGNKSSFSKGGIPWNKGKSASQETREKMRIAKLGSIGYWSGKKRPNLSGKNNPNYGKIGEKNHLWCKEKKHSFHKSIRELYQYRKWRTEVFKRDNYVCIMCSYKGYIEADHFPKSFISIIRENNIKSFDEAIKCEALWDINNGRTLCRDCHKKTPNYMKKLKLDKAIKK